MSTAPNDRSAIGRRTLLGTAAAAGLAPFVIPLAGEAQGNGSDGGAWQASAAALRQTGDGQQRWISIPHSRLALNPNNSTLTQGEVSQNSGPALPLGANYIANDWYNQHRSILTTSLSDQALPPAPTGEHPFPPVGSSPALDEDFSAPEDWVTTSGDATLTPGEDGGTVTIGKDSSSGSVTRTLTVDLDDHPLIAIDVAGLSDQWALKLHDEELDKDYALQEDTAETGVHVYDIAQITGWSGRRSFGVKIYACGGAKGSTTTYRRVALLAAGTSGWDRRALRTSTAWQPDHLEFEAHYEDGSVLSGTEHLHDVDGAVRTIDARRARGWIALAGTLLGAADYDDGDRVLTVVEENLTSAIALPRAAQVRFTQASGWDPTEEPSASSTWWTAGVRASGTLTVGLGFAVGEDRDGASKAALAARDASPEEGIEERRREIDDFLAQVPTPQDFSLRLLDDARGVESQDVRSAYYRGWVNILHNVLPATPETGNDWAAIGTDKADNWMKGVPGAAQVACWDSLLAAQHLVQVDAGTAWSTLSCILTQVQADGRLDGQNLPARLAQTLWVLYQVSGEKDQLQTLYEPLARWLPWAAENPRWIAANNDIPDEVNASFVVSAAFDLQYAQKIAEELDMPEDAARWQDLRASVLEDYADWFFSEDGRLLSVHYLENSHEDATGDPIAEVTGLVLDDVPEDVDERVEDRFAGTYDPDAEFAGFAEKALKAPHWQLTTIGLLARDRGQEAGILANAVLRDIVRSGRFAEVYQAADGTLGDRPIGRGVWPSTFGIDALIDAIWMNNGVRTDDGKPAAVDVEGLGGHVSGLRHLGEVQK
ncbi:MAG: hypothetical protein ACTH6N_03545 [Brachybacterium tyrofermentans]|uniref:hypothetical protein n=1 Tax=Brachybacterium tyrofermentans TaxID=47848 RepID=UPI001867C1FE|nr:hypothetical protein [Brachybacterium tyrofermentans]